MKLKVTQTIHLSFCIAVLLFSTVVFVLNKENLFFDASLANSAPFNPLFPIVSLLGISVGLFLYKKKLSSLSPELTFDEKFMHYQTAFLIRCAFCEGGALLNVVGCFATNNLFFMVFAGLSFIALLVSRPTKEKVIGDLQLQYPDTEKF
ncbi:MAG: hypothetical protein EOO07_37005 [Chitinophagaceae bacterium]|nr:MAG: hypothetical protein EOO07_37005 [Chitinophagaceae bacterium]